MKQILVIFIVASAIFFTACNSESKRKAQTVVDETPIEQPVEKKEMLENEKPVSQDFAFWAKEIKVRPIQINQNDTYGEGEEPCASLEYTFYFVDSAGNTKDWRMYEFYPKKKPTDTEGVAWYNRAVEDFNKAKKLYEEITTIPVDKIYLEGTEKNVKRIYKGLDLTPKKIGNATVIEDPTVLLWSEYQ